MDVGLGTPRGCTVMEADKGCGAERVVGWKWGRGGVMSGDVGQKWGDVGLGPPSGCPIMEADKGCGAEGVVGWRWLWGRGGVEMG